MTTIREGHETLMKARKKCLDELIIQARRDDKYVVYRLKKALKKVEYANDNVQMYEEMYL